MEKATTPIIHYLSHVDSAITLCEGAALVEVKRGLSKIRCFHRDDPKEKSLFSVMLDQQLLADVTVNSCGTCGCLLTHGYGGGITRETSDEVRNQINSGYRGLKASCEAMAPLLGLFPSGYYLVADFLLLPVTHGQHFMDTPEYRSELHFTHLHIGGEFEFNEMPHFLFPTQDPSRLDQQRVDLYRRRLAAEGTAFPRAIALYLNGSVALLLDGHHKAVAAALEGLPVRTLVIFPVQPTPGLKKQIAGKKRIFLHRARQNAKNPVEFDAVYEKHTLPLLDGDGARLGFALSLQSMDTQMKEPLPRDFHRWTLPDAFRPGPEKQKLRPDKYIRGAGSLLPTQIKGLLAALKPLPADELYAREDFFFLCDYALFFPDSKWLSEADRGWLLDKRREYDYYLLGKLPGYGR